MATQTVLPEESAVREVEIIAKKWRKPNTDEHYHSVRINVYYKYHSKPLELAYVPFELGKDRSYDNTAMIEWAKVYPQHGKARHFLSRHLEEKGVKVTIIKTDVTFKKEL